ncbi:MAG TPA: hypothetical protein VEX43_17535 [Chthoniobacterales bacterium]|nr:hypothetical protein [Chthoniobacterales bacterium]
MRRLLASVAAALSIGTSAAQDAVSPELEPRFSGSAEVGIADKYIYHGYVLENQGAIIQPEFEVLARFYSGAGFLTKASLRLYVFSSFQTHESRDEQTDAKIRSWYEVQVEMGIVLELAKHFTFSASYVRFESPNHAFIAVNAAEFILSIDDSDWLGAYALHPHISWFRPFPGGWESSDEGSYFEFGIEPERSFGKGDRPVTVSFPIAVGVGQKRYYLGEHFGFFSAGVSVSVPLVFIPSSWGEWNLGLSGTYYRLGRNVADASNDGRRNESMFALTFGTEF